jgi:hypothetical protein
MLSAEDDFQGIRGVAFGLVDGMDVAVGGFELGVTKAGGYILDVRAVAEQQSRGSMAQETAMK